jgi:hypothetical protein
MKYLLLLTVLAANASIFADADRDIFYSELKRIENDSLVLSCTVNDIRRGNSNQQYQLVLDPQSDLQDAFAIEFHNQDGLDFTTLIAYEGHNNHIIGHLESEIGPRRKKFVHHFDGVYQDILTLITTKDKIWLKFEQKADRFILRSVDCRYFN